MPDPVWPYAKMQTLYPSMTEVQSGPTASKTSDWPICGVKIFSNSNFFGTSLSFGFSISKSLWSPCIRIRAALCEHLATPNP